MKSDIYKYWLANLPSVPSRIKILLEEHVAPAGELFKMSRSELALFPQLKDKHLDALCAYRDLDNLKGAFERFENSAIRMITWQDPDYPYSFSSLYDAPYAVYLKGKLPDRAHPSVAIVGARSCSPYGKRQASLISGALASASVNVISGMALGIDGIAQQRALDSGSYSLAVLGCGVNVCYPERHYPLYSDLIEKGGVLSEFPIDEPPLKTHFPQRNRLISVLADAVVVIEARKKSGSLITADFALEQGREVYAVPGPADSVLSYGCHSLIDQGARIFLSTEDLLKDLHLEAKTSVTCENTIPKHLSKEEEMIYSRLSDTPIKLSELELLTGLTPSLLAKTLLEMQLKGVARELSLQHYIRA